MEFPKNLWNFQKFGLNLPKKLPRILFGSISESSFGKLLSNDVVIPSPLFPRALSPKSGFGKFFYLPKLLSNFGKWFRQAISASFLLPETTFQFRQVLSASTFGKFFLLAKTTFPFRQVVSASDFGKFFDLPKRLSEKTFHVWHGL